MDGLELKQSNSNSTLLHIHSSPVYYLEYSQFEANTLKCAEEDHVCIVHTCPHLMSSTIRVIDLQRRLDWYLICLDISYCPRRNGLIRPIRSSSKDVWPELSHRDIISCPAGLATEREKWEKNLCDSIRASRVSMEVGHYSSYHPHLFSNKLLSRDLFLPNGYASSQPTSVYHPYCWGSHCYVTTTDPCW